MTRARVKRKATRRRTAKRGAEVKFERRFRAAPEEADRAQKDLVRKLQRARCALGDVMELKTALREGVNNALRHASKLDRRKRVTLAARWRPGQGLWVMVRDEGPGFDPAGVPDPTRPENLEKFSGRGLYMMKLLMDRVEHRDGGRELHLWRTPRPRRVK